jgi:hypothetical protein
LIWFNKLVTAIDRHRHIRRLWLGPGNFRDVDGEAEEEWGSGNERRRVLTTTRTRVSLLSHHPILWHVLLYGCQIEPRYIRCFAKATTPNADGAGPCWTCWA